MGAFIIGSGCFGLFVMACMIAGRIHESRFREKFPPISDDEFVRLCGPDTDREVALKVRRIVAKHLAVEYERIHPSCNFIEDLGAD